MRAPAIGALVLLLAATSAGAQLSVPVPHLTVASTFVDVLPNDAWLCRQLATNLDESTLLGRAVLARIGHGSPDEASDAIQFKRGDGRLGEAIAAFAIESGHGVIYVSDTTDGSTLLHEATHATMMRLAPNEAAAEIARVLQADSVGAIPPDIMDLARRSFTLSFTASADPGVWGLVPMVLTSAALSDSSTAGTVARLVRATDGAAVRLDGNVSKGWGRATIADAYDAAADTHWRYAGITRPDWWTWGEERTFRLIGEVVAYTRAKRCASGE
jgi:hypothetical protein